MKTLIIFVLLAVIFACSTPVKVTTIKEPKVELLENTDSTEYELWVLDPGFETWFIIHLRKGYHSYHYYKMWNLRYVTDWNSRVYSGRYHKYFDIVINYEPNLDYGFDVEEKLYYYFVYVEQELNIPILFGYRHRPIY